MGDGASIVSGIPLSAEPGLGALTIPGYLREVTARFADREALAWRTESGVARWSYGTLWERSVEVAKALIACGVGKDSRVGILMTNRPECLAAAFGTALAGGVVVMLNTFSTPPELDHLLKASGVSMVLFERRVAKKDFAAILRELEPAIRSSRARAASSSRFPFLRRLAMIDADAGSDAAERSRPGRTSSRAATRRRPRCVEARAATVKPADAGALFFSSGIDQPAQGHLPRPAGRRDPVVALAADHGHRGRRPQLDGQRLLLVGQSSRW